MADSADRPAAATNLAGIEPKKTKSVTKKTGIKPVRPRTSEMMVNAIKSLKERGGSSFQGIKSYIATNYKVDSEKLSPFIKKYLKTAVASGQLVQTKGKGASGSFLLAAAKTEKAAVPTAPARGRAASAPKVKKQSAAKVKKDKTPEKAVVNSVEKKSTAPAKAKKTPPKAKKVTKVPTKKPKAPRPKTAAKRKASKKARPKKK